MFSTKHQDIYGLKKLTICKKIFCLIPENFWKIMEISGIKLNISRVFVLQGFDFWSSEISKIFCKISEVFLTNCFLLF